MLQTVFEGYSIVWRRFLPNGITLGLSEGNIEFNPETKKKEFVTKYYELDRSKEGEKIKQISKDDFYKIGGKVSN